MSGRRSMFAAVIAGCGTLPHLGPHPGTGLIAFLICITAVAGAQSGGWLGALVGAVFALAIYGPFYLCGAYDRARISERLSNPTTALGVGE